jgi:hypothetical protein
MSNLFGKIVPEDSPLYRRLVLLALKITANKRLEKRTRLRFEVHLADHCNLKCAGCWHYSCIAPEKLLDVDEYRRDATRLSELTGGCVDDIKLLGGEPLLHDRLAELFEITRNCFKNSLVTILTNGILLPKQNADFWEAAKKYNIIINITRYPVEINIDEIQRIAKSYNVSVEWLGGKSALVKKMWRLPLDINGNQTLKNSFMLCHYANRCMQLRNGKIYPCPTAAYINILNDRFHTNFGLLPPPTKMRGGGRIWRGLYRHIQGERHWRGIRFLAPPHSFLPVLQHEGVINRPLMGAVKKRNYGMGVIFVSFFQSMFITMFITKFII